MKRLIGTTAVSIASSCVASPARYGWSAVSARRLRVAAIAEDGTLGRAELTAGGDVHAARDVVLGRAVTVTDPAGAGVPALVPPSLAKGAAPLPAGLATIFRRAEWPDDWPGLDRLPEGANLGLSLRLEASIFELERFQALSLETVTRVILAFHAAVAPAAAPDPEPARRTPA